MIFISNSCAVLIEMALSKKTNMEDEYFGMVLNTPFVTTTVGTTAAGWFPIAFYLWYYQNAFAGQYFVFLGYNSV